MTEVVVRPDGHPGYVHRQTRLEQTIVERMDGQVIEHMSRREFAEQCSRDVSADPNLPLAEVYPDEETGTVTFILDSRTAAAAVYAMRCLAADKEAHAREVRAVAERLPEQSYGAKNRYEIADRQDRVARRMRAVEWAYGKVVDGQWHGI